MMYIIHQLIALITYFFSAIGRFYDWFIHRYVYVNTIVFNCAWEDPVLDLKALEIRKDEDTILVITSAGCNVLTYAIHQPKHIFAIDRNPCQNALLELKIVAIKHLTYSEFWQMFGEGRLPDFTKAYYPKLRRFLSPASQKFWDAKSHYFDGKGMRNSFFYRGCSGLLAWIVIQVYCRLIPGVLAGFKAMFEAKTVQEQRKYSNEIFRKFWSPLFERIVSSRVALSFMNGVPKPQQNLLEKEGGIAVFLRKVFTWLMNDSLLRENYFYRVYLDGKYTKDCCPEYLKEENFYKLKNGLVDRISIHTMLITEFLESHPEQTISRYILLDHMDWLSESPAILKEEWQAFINNATEDCRFLWRSASEKSNFVKDVVVSHKGKRKSVGELLKFNDELAETLHKVDRVHTYTSFHIGDLQSA